MFNESGNHPKEDLAKSGYQPDMKYKIFNHPFIYIFATHGKSKIEKSGGFLLLFFPSPLTSSNLEPPKSLLFPIYLFFCLNFSLKG
jgi:hypothetical protein